MDPLSLQEHLLENLTVTLGILGKSVGITEETVGSYDSCIFGYLKSACDRITQTRIHQITQGYGMMLVQGPQYIQISWPNMPCTVVFRSIAMVSYTSKVPEHDV